MSASTERKNRIAAREAGTDKKTIAAQEAEKKKAESRRRWTWGTIGVAVLIAAILLLNSGLMYTTTTALTANGVKYTPAEVNYYYGNEYLTMVNNYGSYLSYFGLDTSMGLAGLGDQECSMTDGGTWRDYFREQAKTDLQQTRALLDYAKENGISLTDEEIAEIDAQFEGMEETAKSYGYGSADKLYAMNYGSGVTTKIVRQAALDQALAQKAYNEKLESLTYSDEELEEYYQSLEGEQDLFDFDTYYVTAKTVETTVPGEDGAEDTVEMTADDQSRAEAKATADAIVMAYKDGWDTEDVKAPEDTEVTEDAADFEDTAAVTDPAERFALAVESQTEAQPTEHTKVSGAGLNDAYAEWIKVDRKAGDIEVFADAETDPTGYTVVLFLAREDNHYPTASVRHILIKAEADEEGNYTDEAKATAKTRAEEILAEYQAGDKTEESFAALAEKYSEDTGSNTNGGLYENIYQGQMVQEFNDFCFGGHKPGDTAIVYGESSSYAGYHVVYYAGDGDLYSNYIAKSALQSEAMSGWTNELNETCTVTEGFGFRFVGK